MADVDPALGQEILKLVAVALANKMGAHCLRDLARQDDLSGNSGVAGAGWVRGRGSPRAKAAQELRVTKR